MELRTNGSPFKRPIPCSTELHQFIGSDRRLLASNDPATALNLFSSTTPASPQLLKTLQGTDFLLQFNSRNVTIQGLLRGTLLTLPAGPVKTAFGVEYDGSRLYVDQHDADISGNPVTNHRDAYAAFAEARIPLWNGGRGDGEEKLVASIAGRYDYASDFGGKSTGQVGLEWRPTKAILIRGAYATAYQAPLMNQLAGVSSQFLDFWLCGFIPWRRNYRRHAGAKRSKSKSETETGKSESVGVVYKSESIPGLIASVTYADIIIDNFISIPDVQTLIDNPTLFPGAITRAAQSPQDIAQGFLGTITSINDTYYNFGRLQVSGVDYDLHYIFDTDVGSFTPGISVSQTLRYDTALQPGQPTVSNLGQASTQIGFSPRWKGTISLDWESRPVRGQHRRKVYRIYNDYRGFAPTPHNIGNFWLIDGRVRWHLGDALSGGPGVVGGSYVEIGGVNLFNELPKPSYYYFQFDSAEADIRGRFLYIQVGTKF